MEGDRILGNVRHVDRERFALAEPARAQPSSQATYRPLKIGITQRPPGRTVYQRRLIAKLLRAMNRETSKIAIWDISLKRPAGIDHSCPPSRLATCNSFLRTGTRGENDDGSRHRPPRPVALTTLTCGKYSVALIGRRISAVLIGCRISAVLIGRRISAVLIGRRIKVPAGTDGAGRPGEVTLRARAGAACESQNS